MKNKQSRPPSTMKSETRSRANNSSVDPNSIKRKITQKNKPLKTQSHNDGPTKTQIDRLKKFYYTTKWLPNSAFTTYFGKPAFENYGYGNTKPVYGGLFYGNYMLSHNINPIDGENMPPTKQVYSSAMLKTLQRGIVRKPEPPRKVPDEIRNTPAELEEIKERNPIFQLNNEYPSRPIHKPNLVKSKYFRSAKGTPNSSFDEGQNQRIEEMYDQFDINEVLDPNFKRKSQVVHKNKETAKNYNPFKKSSDEKKEQELRERKHQLELMESRKFEEKSKREEEKNAKFEKDLKNEYDDNNLDNKRNSKFEENKNQTQYKQQENKYPNQSQNNENQVQYQNKSNNELRVQIEQSQKQQYANKTNTDIKNQIEPQQSANYVFNSSIAEENLKKGEESEIKINSDKLCRGCSSAINPYKALKKKENPCLVDPELLVLCCQHDQKPQMVDLNPKNYKIVSPCLLNNIPAAGKQNKMSEPVGNLFK